MIVCAIEDLIFAIKIKTAAKQLGVDIHFERQRDSLLPAIREKRPSLVIFDLNSSRLAPMDTIAAMKADPELKRVMTIGYVSHVDSDAIAAARQAGCDQVLARSTFTERLGAILESDFTGRT
jgi:CheY-like chemotaxis protein